MSKSKNLKNLHLIQQNSHACVTLSTALSISIFLTKVCGCLSLHQKINNGQVINYQSSLLPSLIPHKSFSCPGLVYATVSQY